MGEQTFIGLRPMDFPEKDQILTAPPGVENCEPLCVQHMPDGTIRSEWQISPHDLKELIISRRIVLSVWSSTGTHPPVALWVKGTL